MESKQFVKDYGKEEYEIQLLNFSLKQLKLEHRFMVKFELKNIINAFTSKMVKKLQNENTFDETLTEIKVISADLIKIIYSNIESNCKQFDDIVDNYFQIPNTALLPEDILHNVYSIKTEEYLIETVADMEKTFQQNQLMVVAMEAELGQLNSIAHIMEKENKIAEKLEQTFKEIESFQENLDFSDIK